MLSHFRPWYIDGLKPKAGRNIVIALDFGVLDEADKEKMIEILELILQLMDQSDKVCSLKYASVLAELRFSFLKIIFPPSFVHFLMVLYPEKILLPQ